MKTASDVVTCQNNIAQETPYYRGVKEIVLHKDPGAVCVKTSECIHTVKSKGGGFYGYGMTPKEAWANAAKNILKIG